MPYYRYTGTEVNQHYLSHQEEIPDRIKQPYCRICYKKLSPAHTPTGYQNFWNWISTHYNANDYSGFTQLAFRYTIQSLADPDPDLTLNYITGTLKSIRYSQTTTPFWKLCYQTRFLLELTHNFTTPVTTQLIIFVQNYINNFNQLTTAINPVLPNNIGITNQEMQAIFNGAF